MKTGRFSTVESLCVRQNFQNYVQMFGGDYSSLFGVGRKGKTKRNDLARLTCFHARLGKKFLHRYLVIAISSVSECPDLARCTGICTVGSGSDPHDWSRFIYLIHKENPIHR